MCSDDGGRLSCSSLLLKESPASKAAPRNPRWAPRRRLGCGRRPSLGWNCRGFPDNEPCDGSYTPGWSTDSKGWTASLRRGSAGGRGETRRGEKKREATTENTGVKRLEQVKKKKSEEKWMIVWLIYKSRTYAHPRHKLFHCSSTLGNGWLEGYFSERPQ